MKTEEQLRDEHEERKAYEKSEMDTYFQELAQWEAYIESIEPKKEDMDFCHPDNGSFMEAKFNKAYSEWEMKRSCDAPNRPGYYRANND